jgi:hypothetical protein
MVGRPGLKSPRRGGESLLHNSVVTFIRHQHSFQRPWFKPQSP